MKSESKQNKENLAFISQEEAVYYKYVMNISISQFCEINVDLFPALRKKVASMKKVTFKDIEDEYGKRYLMNVGNVSDSVVIVKGKKHIPSILNMKYAKHIYIVGELLYAYNRLDAISNDRTVHFDTKQKIDKIEDLILTTMYIVRDGLSDENFENEAIKFVKYVNDHFVLNISTLNTPFFKIRPTFRRVLKKDLKNPEFNPNREKNISKISKNVLNYLSKYEKMLTEQRIVNPLKTEVEKNSAKMVGLTKTSVVKTNTPEISK